jgi:nickel/cobalt transporter (NicO) family protein
MRRANLSRTQCVGLIHALVLSFGGPTPARADTVASLLGNFTINQYCGLHIASNRIDVHYVVVFGQLPALRELHLADTNSDGVTTPAERDAYLAKLAANYARGLAVVVDGAALPLALQRLSSSLPGEQAGFSLRFDVDFSGQVPQATHARHLAFTNTNYPGRIGWHEIAVRGADGISLYDSSAFGNSLTDGLSATPQSLPPAGALDEREAQLSFVSGLAPAQSTALRMRASAPDRVATATPATAHAPTGDWLSIQTRRLLDLVSGPSVPLRIKLLALLGALILGALHAFSPGHGKTVVGAYLIGSRGTPRHAAFLGLIVTVTHTLGVFLLGFGTLFAANYVVPERLFPVITIISGLMVVGIGATLLVQRIRSRAPGAMDARYDYVDMPVHGALVLSPAMAPFSMRAHHRAHGDHDHGHHAHADDVGHAHHHDHGTGGLVHSHGGTVHSHLPPIGADERITVRSLLALGVSGGLLPCPSAMVLLLAAVALNKTALGLLLVVAFSVGLAATLTLVGVLFLYARRLVPQIGGHGRWARQLPIASAAVITLVGVAICYGALAAAGTAP